MAAQRVSDSNTLVTATLDEGRLLARKLALLFARAAWHDALRDNPRQSNVADAKAPLPVDQVVAISFAMIAVANDYWHPPMRRKKWTRRQHLRLLRPNQWNFPYSITSLYSETSQCN